MGASVTYYSSSDIISSMINYLLYYDEMGLLAMRVIIGLILIARCATKVRGSGVSHLAITGALVGLLIILGLFTQILCLLWLFITVLSFLKIKANKKFLLGLESDFLLIASMLALITLGPGDYSIDRIFGLELY